MNLYIVIASTLISSISYAFFSKIYGSLTEKLYAPICTSILYFLASIILFISTILAALLFGFHCALPTNATFLNTQYTDNVLVIPLLISICVMSICYSVHIVSEAKARATTSISSYAILFQTNIIVVAAIDIYFNHTAVNMLIVLGGLSIILASTGAFINNNGMLSKTNARILGIALVSAISCGVALYIDGMVSNQVIFQHNNPFKNLSLFLLYEMLTFLLPFLITSVWIFISLKTTMLRTMYGVYIKNQRAFWLSALFSVLQFVFSVLALSYSEHRLVAAALLGTAPFFSVLIDSKPLRHKTVEQRSFDFIFALFTLFGIVLVTYQQVYFR
jgi:hypothetical protein